MTGADVGTAAARRALWDSSADGDEYGRVFYARATGALPEMESAKAAARRVRARIRAGDSVLDVACGAGHYLRTLRSQVDVDFSYTGLDGSPRYMALAKQAFAADPAASFTAGDAFRLPFPARSFDVVMCNNVLLHLPSIEKPIAELVRVARRFVLVRTLVGDRSFRVQDVQGADDEFDDVGEPRSFHWYNIYSRSYVQRVFRASSRVAAVAIEEDRDFDPARIAANTDEQPRATDATSLLEGWQVNGYLLLPWSFVEVELEA